MRTVSPRVANTARTLAASRYTGGKSPQEQRQSISVTAMMASAMRPGPIGDARHAIHRRRDSVGTWIAGILMEPSGHVSGAPTGCCVTARTAAW